MPESKPAELEAFRRSVLEEIRQLDSMVEAKAGFSRNPLRADAPDRASLAQNVIYGASLRVAQNMLKNFMEVKRIDELTAEARAFLKESETKVLLCASLLGVEENLSRLALRSIRRDAEEIASAMTPLLYPLAQAGRIRLRRHAVAFALCAWILARTGLRNYCPQPPSTAAETEPLSL